MNDKASAAVSTKLPYSTAFSWPQSRDLSLFLGASENVTGLQWILCRMNHWQERTLNFSLIQVSQLTGPRSHSSSFKFRNACERRPAPYPYSTIAENEGEIRTAFFRASSTVLYAIIHIVYDYPYTIRVMAELIISFDIHLGCVDATVLNILATPGSQAGNFRSSADQ
ncbi:hypothetical protein EI94DRAFT_1028954 [Lactarius quietus]|nr:hypothetical protein EI94DRAFT_1028954 [Lactarius quietus]